MYRPSWIEIDREAIRHNVRELKRRIPQEMMAVVKANGYGHGAVEVARIALEQGATQLAVALLEEAIELREAGIEAPILVLEVQLPEYASVASDYGVALSVFDAEWVREAREQLNGRTLRVHIKCDTGMGRLGLRTREELDTLLTELEGGPFQVDGIFTHFATADELDSSLYDEQDKRFRTMIAGLESRFTWIHASNSAAAIRKANETDLYNLVRVGIVVYGLLPSNEMTTFYDFLRPAFSLKSRLLHVKLLEAGQPISYGATYVTTQPEWIGTVPVGYADGWIRKTGKYEVVVDGERCPIVGRVCMDRFMVRLPRRYPVGTLVTLIGEGAPIDELAAHLETINYEIVCQMTSRLPRLYVN